MNIAEEEISVRDTFGRRLRSLNVIRQIFIYNNSQYIALSLRHPTHQATTSEAI